jgi:hypothetical protein
VLPAGGCHSPISREHRPHKGPVDGTGHCRHSSLPSPRQRGALAVPPRYSVVERLLHVGLAVVASLDSRAQLRSATSCSKRATSTSTRAGSMATVSASTTRPPPCARARRSAARACRRLWRAWASATFDQRSAVSRSRGWGRPGCRARYASRARRFRAGIGTAGPEAPGPTLRSSKGRTTRRVIGQRRVLEGDPRTAGSVRARTRPPTFTFFYAALDG